MIQKDGFAVSLLYINEFLKNWGENGFMTTQLSVAEFDEMHKKLSTLGIYRIQTSDGTSLEHHDIILAKDNGIISIDNAPLDLDETGIDSQLPQSVWDNLDPSPFNIFRIDSADYLSPYSFMDSRIVVGKTDSDNKMPLFLDSLLEKNRFYYLGFCKDVFAETDIVPGSVPLRFTVNFYDPNTVSDVKTGGILTGPDSVKGSLISVLYQRAEVINRFRRIL